MARTLNRQEVENIAIIHAVPPAAPSSPQGDPQCMMTAGRPYEDEETQEPSGLMRLLSGEGLQTETGYCPSTTALTQILLLPGLIIFWGVIAVGIAAMVG